MGLAYGLAHAILMAQQQTKTKSTEVNGWVINRKDDKMADAKSKVRWEAENVLKIGLKINRNQDPELYELLSKAPSRSGLARDLMNQAIKMED